MKTIRSVISAALIGAVLLSLTACGASESPEEQLAAAVDATMESVKARDESLLSEFGSAETVSACSICSAAAQDTDAYQAEEAYLEACMEELSWLTINTDYENSIVYLVVNVPESSAVVSEFLTSVAAATGSAAELPEDASALAAASFTNNTPGESTSLSLTLTYQESDDGYTLAAVAEADNLANIYYANLPADEADRLAGQEEAPAEEAEEESAFSDDLAAGYTQLDTVLDYTAEACAQGVVITGTSSAQEMIPLAEFQVDFCAADGTVLASANGESYCVDPGETVVVAVAYYGSEAFDHCEVRHACFDNNKKWVNLSVESSVSSADGVWTATITNTCGKSIPDVEYTVLYRAADGTLAGFYSGWEFVLAKDKTIEVALNTPTDPATGLAVTFAAAEISARGCSGNL